jgi:hypothetical protein
VAKPIIGDSTSPPTRLKDDAILSAGLQAARHQLVQQ